MQTSTLALPALKPFRADSAGAIRPFAADDARSVANLLMRAFQHSDAPAPEGMIDYLREVYLDNPSYDPQIASRVMTGADGRVAGFVGVVALPMEMEDQPIRAAVISSLAVDERIPDPMVGARLLRDVRSGPQDAMLSDRSNAAAVSLLRSLKGEVFRDYSLDWLRSIRPAGLATSLIASRFGPARVVAPLLRPLDAMALRKSQDERELRWTTPGSSAAAEAFTDRDITPDELPGLVRLFLADYPLRPRWSETELKLVLAHGAQKRDVGDFTARVVLGRDQTPAGLFLYHLRPHGVARVLQIMAHPKREGVVIDRAIAHAATAGAVAIGGRAQPALLEALMERRAVLLPELSTTVYSRNENVLRHFREGTAFFTGLAGEYWMRLNGDRF